jgi:MFS family permease
VGYLASGLGAGYLIGAAVGRHALARFGVRNVLGAAQLAIGGSFFALFNSPDLPVAVLATALLGIPGSILLVSVETHVQRIAPPGMLGRVGALFYAVDSLAAIVGALCGPALVTGLGLTAGLNAISAFALLAVVATWGSVPREAPRSAALSAPPPPVAAGDRRLPGRRRGRG